MSLHLVSLWVINTLVVTFAIIIHYEALYLMSRKLNLFKGPHRYRILIGVFGTLVAHALEVWMFAIAYYIMHKTYGWGRLMSFTDPDTEIHLFDCVYFSFSTYSTLGYGDIAPTGDMRYLTGIEALTGLVLVAWSASFLYLEMEQNWTSLRANRDKGNSR
jgi:hypothetical protein